MAPTCPECDRKLTKREPNYLKHVRQRSVGNPHHRYVCFNCGETFAEDQVVDRDRVNISMKRWMETDDE